MQTINFVTKIMLTARCGAKTESTCASSLERWPGESQPSQEYRLLCCGTGIWYVLANEMIIFFGWRMYC